MEHRPFDWVSRAGGNSEPGSLTEALDQVAGYISTCWSNKNLGKFYSDDAVAALAQLEAWILARYQPISEAVTQTVTVVDPNEPTPIAEEAWRAAAAISATDRHRAARAAHVRPVAALPAVPEAPAPAELVAEARDVPDPRPVEPGTLPFGVPVMRDKPHTDPDNVKVRPTVRPAVPRSRPRYVRPPGG